MNCPEVNDLLPEYVLGDLPMRSRRDIAAHLEACTACAETLATGRALMDSRPPAPVGLEARVREAVHAEVDGAEAEAKVLRLEPRGRRALPTWMLGAAALLLLAVGTPVLMNRMGEAPAPYDDAAVALAERTWAPSMWASDDGLIAGDPTLEGLTDEALEALLAELEEEGA